MPSYGTHITVVEQLALHNSDIKKLLGDPLADPDTPEGIKMRFAKLGALGPDPLYMLLAEDNSALQNRLNFLVKVGGAFEWLREVSEQVDSFLLGKADNLTAGLASELKKTGDLFVSVISGGFLALFVEPIGINLWGDFRPPKQKGDPIEEWFWADCLHYVFTGDFTHHLLDAAKKTNDGNLYAYALGYLTHYITDVVGHPYVNQVVRGPYRAHWQRHHLIENFIDAYVWNRWHVQWPDPGGAREPPLDAPTLTPNSIGAGAPTITSRMHEHIRIGNFSLDDPVDNVIEAVRKKIEQGMFDIGVAEDIDLASPENTEFKKLCELLSKSIEAAYKGKIHSQLLGKNGRNGSSFPTAEDVASACIVLRLVMRVQTEEGVKAPVFPDIEEDVTDVIEKIMKNVREDIGGIPPVPVPNTTGSFSVEDLIDALCDIAQWVAEAAKGIAKAVADIVEGLVEAGETMLSYPAKIGLWLFQSALYALYRYFRSILMMNAYVLPYPDEIDVRIRNVKTRELWVSSVSKEFAGSYPAQEDPRAKEPWSNYRPYIRPDMSKMELPGGLFISPYAKGSEARPEAFLEAPIGPDNMFDKAAPQIQTTSGGDKTFTNMSKNFGGAIANSAKAIRVHANGAGLVLPNYDMDGDRGYAWPGWIDVNSDPTHVSAIKVTG